jgi:hypothetical protein
VVAPARPEEPLGATDGSDRHIIGPSRRVWFGDAAHHSLRRDDSDSAVFRFVKPEDAEAFCEQSGGERLPTTRQ